MDFEPSSDSDSSSDSDVEYNKTIIIETLNKLRGFRDASRATLAPSSPVASTSRDSTCSQDQTHSGENIEKLINLGQMMQGKLQELETEVKCRLAECNKKLKEVQKAKEEFVNKAKPDSFNYVICGKPYFKNKYNFPAPDNEDTIRMRASEMFDFSTVTSVPGWTLIDKRDFSKMIRQLSEEIAVKKLKSEIAALNRKNKNPNKKEKKEIKNKIDEIEKDIVHIHQKEMKEIALPLDEDYDWDRVSKMLKRHSAEEYKSLWKLFLHPSINKNKWTKDEHAALQSIAPQHNHQNWEVIAAELNTGRSGYQCFVYFRTNICHTFLGQKWTQEEEQYLMRLVAYYKEGQHINWGKVASCIENRTKIQIYNKYMRLTESRKGRFVPEEDIVLLKCISQFGNNYKKIANYLPGRSKDQLRIRYKVLLKNQSIVWTLKEDEKLLAIMANKEVDVGDYSSLTKYFPGKERSHVRSRYMTLMKWMNANPSKKLSQAPRRGPRRLLHSESSEIDLNTAIQKLHKRLQQESEDNREAKFESSEGQSIDNTIALFIFNEDNKKIKEKEKELSDKMLDTTENLNVDNLVRILILLKAKLDKKKFLESPYASKYPSLLQQRPQPVKTLKSYSKKRETHINNPVPDIWGNCTLETSDYVLPPNYSSITGVIRLMEFCNQSLEKEGICYNINPLIRENPKFREFYYQLLDRFSLLFLWSILLSKVPKSLE